MTRRLAITYRGIGEFFREGGVLVAVFGILDYVVRDGTISYVRIAEAFGLGVALLVVGLAFERSTEPRDE